MKVRILRRFFYMQNSGLRGGAVEIAKSVCISVIVTLAAVLLFAFLIKIFSIGSSVITPVNQIIKALAIFAGCLFSLRESKGWLKGAISGILVILLTYFIFAIIAREISFGVSNVVEFLFGGIAGAISGVIAVNLRGSRS